MSKRIDLTQEELRESLFQEMTKDYNQNQFIDTRAEWYSVDEIMDGIEHLGFLAELKRCYERIDELVDILSLLEDRQGVEIPCTHDWVIEDEHYTYQGVEWITRYVYCEYCGDESHDLSFDQTVEDFQNSSK